MARPRTITDEQIRAAAREVLVEYGPSAPVTRIAQKLGVSHSALFERVGSKKQLLLTALGPMRPPAVKRLAEAPPREGTLVRLGDILIELMVFFREVVPNLIVLRASGTTMAELPPSEEGPPPVALRWALTRWLERASQAGVLAPMSAWAVAEGLLGAMEARCFHRYLGGGAFTPGDDDTFVRELVNGLVPRSQGGTR